MPETPNAITNRTITSEEFWRCMLNAHVVIKALQEEIAELRASARAVDALRNGATQSDDMPAMIYAELLAD